jgi:hypothetical protein
MRGFGRSNSSDDEDVIQHNPNIPGAIPLPPPIPPDVVGAGSAYIPRPQGHQPIPPVKKRRPPGVPMNRAPSPVPGAGPPGVAPRSMQRSMCAICHKTTGSFLAALDQKFHPECFKCIACRELIDPYGQFKAHEDEQGKKQPYHIPCHAEVFGIKCSVCRHSIPASNDGTVAYVKHPFFEKELMCIKHADHRVRVCSGCKRFEPYDKPFIGLGDANRCICHSCVQSVLISDEEVLPLWKGVLHLFESRLNLPVWNALRDMSILLVSSDTLREQLGGCFHPHEGAKQLMCSGLCLTDQNSHNHRVKRPSLRFEKSTGSYESYAMEDFEIPRANTESSRSAVNLVAVVCLCGLPRDLTACVLAHQATHAWFMLHPKYDPRKPLSPEVEEGCAQLVTMLFLREGLDQTAGPANDAKRPSGEQLREYLKFSIERDSSDMYGVSYRKAASVYRDIGIDALLSHVMQYGEFPHT